MNRQALIQRLRREEAIRGEPYDDATGRPIRRGTVVQGYVTIGVGRNLNANPLTEQEILYLLDHDIDDTLRDLDAHLPWWRGLSEARQLVLADMAFNMGVGDADDGLLEFHNTLRAMQEGRYKDAAEGMRNSLWYRQVGQRAEELATMMEEG